MKNGTCNTNTSSMHIKSWTPLENLRLTDFLIGLLCFSISLFKLLLQCLKLLNTSQPLYIQSSRKFKDFSRTYTEIQVFFKEKWNSRTFQAPQIKFKDFSGLCKPWWIADTRGRFLLKTTPQIIYWQITVSRMHDKVYIFQHVSFKAIPVHFSIQGNHPTFLFVDCCFDITLHKHSIIIANTCALDNLSLDDKTIVVNYKQV